MAAAAALATFDLFDQLDTLSNVRQRAAQLQHLLKPLAALHMLVTYANAA